MILEALRALLFAGEVRRHSHCKKIMVCVEDQVDLLKDDAISLSQFSRIWRILNRTSTSRRRSKSESWTMEALL